MPYKDTGNNHLWLQNTTSTQEYFISVTKSSKDSITESDWADAVSPVSELDITDRSGVDEDRIVYVYTRFKETSQRRAGTYIAADTIYWTGRKGNSSSDQRFLNLEHQICGKASTDQNYKVGDVMMITATVQPSTSTWNGVPGNKWYSNLGIEHNSDFAWFYSDSACEHLIDNSNTTAYKKVYLKLLKQVNGLTISAIPSKDFYASFDVCIADENGYYQIDEVEIPDTNYYVEIGGSIGGIPVSVSPESNNDFSTEGAFAKLCGKVQDRYNDEDAPALYFDPSRHTMTIDAASSKAQGYYVYDIYNTSGKKVATNISVSVMDRIIAPEQVSFKNTNVDVNAGEFLSLYPLLSPIDAIGSFSWTSTDESVATVADNGNSGRVFIPQDAAVGSSATITVVVNGDSSLTASCTVTVVDAELPQLDVSTIGYSATVTMNENFNLNLYVKNVEESLAEGLTVYWTFDGRNYNQNLGALTPQTGGQYSGAYKITLAQVFSYQMTLPFHIEVKYDDEVIKSIDYSVQQYFVNSYNKTKDAVMKKIYGAALDYGAAAQLYFDGKTFNDGIPYEPDAGNLANKTTNPSNTITATKPSNKVSKSGNITGMDDKFTATLIFGSETSIKVYFTYSGNIDDMSIDCNNDKFVTVPILQADGRYSVKVEGIRSFELCKDYTISFKAGGQTRTLTYSPYVYAANKWNNSDANMARLAKALVAYGDAAKAKWQ